MGTVLTVTAFGLGFGVAGLVRPQLLANRYSTTAYASNAGMVSIPVTLTKADGPIRRRRSAWRSELDRC